MSLLFTPEEKMRKMRRRFKIRQKETGGLEKSNEIYNSGLLFQIQMYS